MRYWRIQKGHRNLAYQLEDEIARCIIFYTSACLTSKLRPNLEMLHLHQPLLSASCSHRNIKAIQGSVNVICFLNCSFLPHLFTMKHTGTAKLQNTFASFFFWVGYSSKALKVATVYSKHSQTRSKCFTAQLEQKHSQPTTLIRFNEKDEKFIKTTKNPIVFRLAIYIMIATFNLRLCNDFTTVSINIEENNTNDSFVQLNIFSLSTRLLKCYTIIYHILEIRLQISPTKKNISTNCASN